jgi:hypothetical protein
MSGDLYRKRYLSGYERGRERRMAEMRAAAQRR